MIHPKAAAAVDLAREMEEQKQLADTLRAEPGYLGHVLRLRARRDSRRVLLVVDRFEELYTQWPTRPNAPRSLRACRRSRTTRRARCAWCSRSVFTKLEAAMERALADTPEGWTYAPFRLNRAAVPACFAVSFHVRHSGEPVQRPRSGAGRQVFGRASHARTLARART